MLGLALSTALAVPSGIRLAGTALLLGTLALAAALIRIVRHVGALRLSGEGLGSRLAA
jgi:hypothetical protein